MTPLDPAAVERFRADTLRLLPTAPTPDAPLGIATSGGPDSMALLALAIAAFPHAVAAATIDHRLRSESAAEAEMVEAWCLGRGVPHVTLVADRDLAGSGLQEQARMLRYRLLGEWAAGRGIAAIATAHHADDQAETFLMRAVRGAGLAGLRGIPARNLADGVMIVRPLLDWRRAALMQIVEAVGIPHCTDPSNGDPRFERVRVRRLLAGTPWLDPEGLAASARHLAELDRDMGALVDWLWGVRAAAGAGAVTIDVAGLPREAKRRLLRRAIEQVRSDAAIAEPGFSAASNVEPLLDRLERGIAATQAGVVARPEGGIWRFSKAPSRRSI